MGKKTKLEVKFGICGLRWTCEGKKPEEIFKLPRTETETWACFRCAEKIASPAMHALLWEHAEQQGADA